MKIFGDEPGREVEEITIVASPDHLRKVAAFLIEAAEDIEGDPNWEHIHLQDRCDEDWYKNNPDVVVYHPKVLKDIKDGNEE